MIEKKKSRIDILDNYRFIAILSVMLYHYYSRWIPPLNKVSLYPYGSNYNYFPYGYLGVEFFFIISGFVIAFTLTKTDNLVEFWKKRFIRLLPPMFICSLVTLIVCRLIDVDDFFSSSHSMKNFIFSQSFFSPDVINKLIAPYNFSVSYTNGSYWSLWPEIQFYLVASCIYFLNRKNFVRNVAVFTISICLINYFVMRVFSNVLTTNRFSLNISQSSMESYKFWTQTVFNYIEFSLYFIIGVLFFQLYSTEKKVISIFFISLSVFILLFLNGGLNFNQFMPVHSIFIMVLLFLGFIYYSKQLGFILFQPIANIGVASYSLYLIHENIGVLLISKYAFLLGKYDYFFPVFVILLMIFFSLFSFRYIEKPIGAYLKKKMI